MKFLFYYYKFQEGHPRYHTQGVSFRSHADDLVRGLTQLKHEVKVLPYIDTTDEEKLKTYKTFQPDFVINVESWRCCLPTLAHPIKYGLKVVPYLVSDGWVYPYYRDFLNKLPLLLVPSEWVKTVFKRDGVTTPRIEVVKESVNTDLFKPADDPEKIRKWREQYGIQDQDIMLLIFGGEILSKGGYKVIEAIKKIGNKNIKLVAKSNPENPAVKNDLKYIAESGIADQIIYLTEIISQEELVTMYQACDIYTAPSRNEGFGRPHIEAQACGKPVITIDASAARENVKHLQTGYIVKVAQTLMMARDIIYDEFRQQPMKMIFNPPIQIAFLPDVDDLVSAIKLLSDNKIRKKMGRQARHYMIKNFDTLVLSKQFIQSITNFFKF